MTWVIVSLMLCAFGTNLIYLASPNQTWFSPSIFDKKTTLTLRYLGWIGLILSLGFALQGVSILTAVFMWLIAIMVLLGILPFLSLLKPRKSKSL